MPIKGVSDRIRLPRKGIIRIGEKGLTKNGKEYPKALNHFVGPDEIHKFFGAEPKELSILFPFDTVEQNYDESLKAYKAGGKLFCRGDGEHAFRSDGKGGIDDLDCPFQECEYYKKKECKQIGVLSFLIPELSITGAYQIWTSSRSSMDNLRSTLNQLYSMFGKLSGIPMTLKVSMQKAHPWVTKDGQAKQMTTEVPILCIECNLSLQKVQRLAARKNMALMAPGESLDTDTYPDTLYLPDRPDETDKPVVNKEEINDAMLALKAIETPELKSDEPGMWDGPIAEYHPIVKKFLHYEYTIKELDGADLITKYMTIVDKVTKKNRKPTLEQIKNWNGEKEIAYLSSALSRIEKDYPQLVTTNA